MEGLKPVPPTPSGIPGETVYFSYSENKWITVTPAPQSARRTTNAARILFPEPDMFALPPRQIPHPPRMTDSDTDTESTVSSTAFPMIGIGASGLPDVDGLTERTITHLRLKW